MNTNIKERGDREDPPRRASLDQIKDKADAMAYKEVKAPAETCQA